MHVELHLVVAAALVGLGIGGALSRRNIIAVIMAALTAGCGAVITMAALARRAGAGETSDALLFALVLGAILLAVAATGCALAYRRFMTEGVAEVDSGNRLRH